jgi:hypothetical protein
VPCGFWNYSRNRSLILHEPHEQLLLNAVRVGAGQRPGIFNPLRLVVTFFYICGSSLDLWKGKRIVFWAVIMYGGNAAFRRCATGWNDNTA